MLEGIIVEFRTQTPVRTDSTSTWFKFKFKRLRMTSSCDPRESNLIWVHNPFDVFDFRIYSPTSILWLEDLESDQTH